MKTQLLTILFLTFCCSACAHRLPQSQLANASPSATPTPIKTPEATPAPAKDSKDVTAEIQKIVADTLKLDTQDVGVNSPLSKLKKPADELDVVEIIMTVEDTFDIEIKDNELGGGDINAATNITVKQLADIVAKRKSGK